ncbi:tripartite tricarboxylate transporter TctB family protein [Agrobacterium sp. T29]|uniref:tripartite tricarboxylate transporter TctB family protein n=1 Tax=Agrobacterium sp. T29 TaxID=2580515 RepID=UPI001FEFB6BC|nr:tripartite tricarboxylate transporter TctB family protein [Agrobacterium sp. T29]
MNVDTRELAGGIFLLALGVAFAAYAAMNYSTGTITRMGPGMIPVALGGLLAFFGVIIAIGAFFRMVEHAEIRWIVPLIVLGSVLVFAALIKPFGLVPAVAGSAIVATFAEFKFRPLFSLTLAVVLCVMAWLIFIVGLQLPIPLIDWSL